MVDNVIIDITNLVIEKTVKQKIPTVVFLSEVKKNELVKNIIYTMKGGNRDESKFTPDDWSKLVSIMQVLAEIPLLVKEIADAGKIKLASEDFIHELNNNKGLLIINSTDINTNCFAKKENISIMIICGSNDKNKGEI